MSTSPIKNGFDEWFDGAFARYEDAKSGIAACMDLISSDFRAADIRSVMRQAWNAALSGSVPAVTRENEIAKQVADGEEVIDALAGVRHDTQRIGAAMNTEKDELDLEQLHATAEKATRGPWFISLSGEGVYADVTAGRAWANMICRVWPAMKNREADAAFIADLNPQTVLRLIEELTRLRSEIAALRESRDGIVQRINSSYANLDLLHSEGFTAKQLLGIRTMLRTILNGEENTHG